MHEERRVRLVEARDSAQMLAVGKIEYLERCAVFAGQEQAVASHIGGEVIEVALVAGQVRAAGASCSG